VNNADFLAGKCTTSFIDDTPELFQLPQRQDRATRVLTYIAEIIVNGHPEASVRALAQSPPPNLIPKGAAPVPALEPPPAVAPGGSRDRFQTLGHDKFIQWIRAQRQLLLTDTTFRDAHQSLLAT